MRFRVVVSRLQVAERSIRAADEETALKVIQDELRLPFGFLGSWRTTNTDIEIVETRNAIDKAPLPEERGPELLSINDAEGYLGISRTTLWQLMYRGDIAQVAIGRCKFISREGLKAFIGVNRRPI